MKDLRDRRTLPRVASEFPLRYRKIPVGRPGFFEASVEDLSARGVRFRCAEDIRVRSTLLFEMVLPGEAPVHSFGRAAWVRERPNHDGFEIGSAFEDQSTAVRKAIERQLQRASVPAGTEKGAQLGAVAAAPQRPADFTA